MSLLLLFGGGIAEVEEPAAVAAVQLVHVREKPPLRLSIDAEAPNGRHYRWADDEKDPENVLADLRFSTTMPGGFESQDCKLPRKAGLDYKDLERLSTLRALGPGAEVAWEGRLERTPQTSGDQMAVNPSAVGWQAHLEDDKSASMIYRDIDLSRWTGPSATRKVALLGASWSPIDAATEPDVTTGVPALVLTVTGPWTATSKPTAEGLYDAGAGNEIGSLYYVWRKGANIALPDANWLWKAHLSTTDTLASLDSTAELRAAGPGAGTLTSTGDKRFAVVQLAYIAGPAGNDNMIYNVDWLVLAVYGDHGLTKRGTEPYQGFYASDVIAHAVGTFAPLLNYTTGTDGSIRDSDFVIEQLAFPERTTASEMVTQANRFHLRDWAVWEDKTFHYHARGERGRSWRARVGPAQLEETGPQIDRLWSSVVVQFQDTDGTTKSVGPVGSGADSESALLEDTDSDNPAVALGMDRTELLQMGVATTASATQVGVRFLAEQKVLSTSGTARLVGHVEDDKGVTHPAWKVRAGDTIVFTDSRDPSPRRVVKTDYSHSDRTTSIDLDSPPEGMASLLERLGVRIIKLGFS